jgi:hypothetical protein
MRDDTAGQSWVSDRAFVVVWHGVLEETSTNESDASVASTNESDACVFERALPPVRMFTFPGLLWAEETIQLLPTELT